MADKKYRLTFAKSDGNTESVEFTAPQGPTGPTGPTGPRGYGIGVSVAEYGAKGDGSTNDTAAFQNALANNRVVFVPGGTYKLSGGLVIRPNCCLELSQDTVLEFSNTSGNCIEMRSSATLRGNHAVLRVPYAFNGHVIDVNTVDDTTKDTPPFAHWDPQWKRGRYIYDVCIVKPDPTYGLNYSVDGNCYGTAIYLGCESENTEVGFIWGAMLEGIRIAGGFTYGIHILNHDDPNDGAEDDAWNHDMRIEAVIQGCETGVSMTNCNGAHLAVTVQPCKYESGPKYAKWGVYLNDCRYVDMIGSRVWDWNEKYTLWTSGGQYQHIALFGNCSGLLLDDFLCSEHSEDIRNLIYTDTESNFDTMSVLQEAGGRNFKSIDGDPYFNNGNKDLRITTEAELSEYFQTDRVLNFTNVMETAIDKNGNVYGTKNGYYDSQFNTLDDDGYHVHTGFIPCKKGDTFYTDGIKLRDDGCVRITLFDSSFNYVKHVNGGNMMKTGYYVTYAETDNGFALTLNSANDAEINKFAYARFNFHNGDLGKHPMMSVNEEIKYTVEGFLADGVKVKAENVIGLESGGGGISEESDPTVPSWAKQPNKPSYTASEVGALPASTKIPAKVSELTNDSKFATETYVNNQLANIPSSGGGVSSWNDLTDKPFGESENAVLLPPTQFALNNTGAGFYTNTKNGMTAGKTYTINWNGTDYTCEAISVVYEGLPAVFVGNPAFVGGTNNGMPFVVAFFVSTMVMVAIPLDGSTSVTVGITGYGDAKIPEKYLSSHIIAVSEDEWDSGEINRSFNDYVDDLYMGVPVFIAMGVSMARVISWDVNIVNSVQESINLYVCKPNDNSDPIVKAYTAPCTKWPPAYLPL